LADILTEDTYELLCVLGLDPLFLLNKVYIGFYLNVQIIHLSHDFFYLLVDCLRIAQNV